MTKSRRKRKPKKDKTPTIQRKENVRVELTEEDIQNKLTELKRFNWDLSADHYRLYERKSRSERKDKVVDSTQKNENESQRHATKGQLILPPLKESETKNSSVCDGRRDVRRNGSLSDRELHQENVGATSSENRLPKKLAHISFVGVYDLEDMRRGKKYGKNNPDKTKLNGVMTSNNSGDKTERENKLEVMARVSTKSKHRAEKEERSGKQATGETNGTFPVKNITLEGVCPGSDVIVAREFILPRIEKNSLLSLKDEGSRQPETMDRVQRRLPNINGIFSERTRNSRRKRRTHDLAYDPVNLAKNVMRLPFLVNGKTTMT